jgi:prophage regulatory protein
MSSPSSAGNLSSNQVLPEKSPLNSISSNTKSALLPDQFIRKATVIKFSGLSSATIYRWMKLGKFPQSIRLTEKTTVWSLQELTQWMEQMKRECR